MHKTTTYGHHGVLTSIGTVTKRISLEGLQGHTRLLIIIVQLNAAIKPITL